MWVRRAFICTAVSGMRCTLVVVAVPAIVTDASPSTNLQCPAAPAAVTSETTTVSVPLRFAATVIFLSCVVAYSHSAAPDTYENPATETPPPDRAVVCPFAIR